MDLNFNRVFIKMCIDLDKLAHQLCQQTNNIVKMKLQFNRKYVKVNINCYKRTAFIQDQELYVYTGWLENQQASRNNHSKYY